jgi:hypothetical protein
MLSRYLKLDLDTFSGEIFKFSLFGKNKFLEIQVENPLSEMLRTRSVSNFRDFRIFEYS